MKLAAPKGAAKIVRLKWNGNWNPEPLALERFSRLFRREMQVDLTVGAGGSPQRLAASSDGLSLMVLSAMEEKISIIDLKGPHVRATRFVRIGRGPYGMTTRDDRTLLFVSHSKDNEVVACDATLADLMPPITPLPRLNVVTKATLNKPMGLAFRGSSRP